MLVWVKLDDSFFEHRKVMILSVRAKLLFLAGLTHSAKNLTDGYLLDGDVRVIRAFAEATPKHVQELVHAKLWERDGGGYSIHDWSDYNPPAEKVRAERAAAKERMRRARSGEQPANVPPEVQGEVPPPPVTRIPSPVAPDGAAAAPPGKPKRIRSSSKNEPLYECNPVLAELANLYENEVGSISAGIDAELRDWCERIPDNERGHAGIQYAFRESAAQGARTWKYIAAILARLEAADWPADPGFLQADPVPVNVHEQKRERALVAGEYPRGFDSWTEANKERFREELTERAKGAR